MRLNVRVAVGVLAPLLAMAAGLWLFSKAPECTSQIVLAQPSPDNHLVAQQEQTICQPLAEITTNIWLFQPGGNQRFNAFEARSTPSAPGSKPLPPLELEIRWISESELFISFPAGPRIVWAPQSVEGIRINQVERVPPPMNAQALHSSLPSKQNATP